MNKYTCIHGHFYQPPRENPWLEEVELQDSAYPYHDWNGRITAECYAPNAASRVLDTDGKIIDIVNNYSIISFNFGPTLLSWMQKNAADVYKQVIEADKESRKRFSGCGSAIAQCYNHMIMPLANTRDRHTQIIWGLSDFERRFGRKADGMWLPETAVDLATLDLLAEYGIKFTILSPYQAKRAKKVGTEEWHDVSGGRIDPRTHYRCHLPSGKQIVLFFYDGPIARDVAFGGLIHNGEEFARKIISTFEKKRQEPQIANIATDGETYGHHHRFSEMALSTCHYFIKSHKTARPTIYAEYLAKYPPDHDVEIFENSSWSCSHGVERWKNNCGCNSGGNAGWTQEWRAPLRNAFDWLREGLVKVFEEEGRDFFKDSWAARNDYVDVILDRSEENINRFFAKHAPVELSRKEKSRALKLLEMQRHAMLMYTSCGWFFDEISGIETVQVIAYAARAIQLAEEVSGKPFEEAFVHLLERAPSNIPEFSDGAKVYERFVKPSVLSLIRVSAHYAVSCLFENYPVVYDLYSYELERKAFDFVKMGRQKLAVGRIIVKSKITWEEKDVCFAALHLGDHNLLVGAREFMGETEFKKVHKEIKERFTKGEISDLFRLTDQYFPDHNYSIWHLFRDEQRKVLNTMFEAPQKEIESVFKKLYDECSPIMRAAEKTNMKLPKPFLSVAQHVLNKGIQDILRAKNIDMESLRKCVSEIKLFSLDLDREMIEFVVSERVTELMKQFEKNSENLSLLEIIKNILDIVKALNLDLDLWKAQNIYFLLSKEPLSDMLYRAGSGDEDAKRWVETFTAVGEHLGVKVSV